MKWPVQPSLPAKLYVTDLEVKSDQKQTACLSVTNKESHLLKNLINRLSSWHRLLGVFAWIVHFKNCFLQKLNKHLIASNKLFDPLTVSELSQAELEIVRYVQHKAYSEEIQTLLNKKQLQKSSSLIRLDPFLDDGRLKHASLDSSVIHPITLPHLSPLTMLLIRNTHIKLAHAGRQHVQAKLRKKYWVIKSSSVICKFLSSCVTCKHFKNKTMSQKMADLPKQRLTPNLPPFTYVGTDLFSPFLTCQGRRQKVKWYGVIFTCLTVCVVHLEMAYSLETSSFIQPLRRFLSTRGQVKEIKSDNGTNLVGANRELQKGIRAWNNQQVQNFLLQKNMSWVFQSPELLIMVVFGSAKSDPHVKF